MKEDRKISSPHNCHIPVFFVFYVWKNLPIATDVVKRAIQKKKKIPMMSFVHYDAVSIP